MSTTPAIAGKAAVWDLRAWRPSDRRLWSLGILAVAVVLFLMAALLWVLSPKQYASARWILVALAGALLALEAAIVLTGILAERAPATPHVGHGPAAPEPVHAPAPEPAAAEEPEPAFGVAPEASAEDAWAAVPTEDAVPTETAAAPAVTERTLRCGGCRNLFTFHDTGVRPLRQACPHCGREGELR